jgi:glycosyltransferase A (GT-A) superfamily protein (DUF2064 family)
MFKAPQRSKRRLAQRIGARATEAAQHLLACAREDAAAWPGPVCYAPGAPTDAEWLAAVAGPQSLTIMQHGTNLGARLNHINQTLCNRAIERQIYIGIDCPELEPAHLDEAERLLHDHDLVIAPAVDGGAVLIGTRRRLPPLAGLPWSTGALERELAAAALASGMSVARLEPPRRDVDTLEDLEAAARALGADPRASRRALCAFVSSLGRAPAANHRRGANR